jgi:hypothetical protein
MDRKYESLWAIRELQDKIVLLDMERWLGHAFVSWNWWLLFVFLIMPWIFWIKLVDRKRIFEIALFGMIIIFITVCLDSLGTHLGFWVYPVKLIPIIPKAFPFDASIIPVAYMLIYQFFKTWKSFFCALLVMALIYAFIGEPFAHWAELVFYIKWKFFYSFLYYIFTGILVRLLILILRNMSKVH